MQQSHALFDACRTDVLALEHRKVVSAVKGESSAVVFNRNHHIVAPASYLDPDEIGVRMPNAVAYELLDEPIDVIDQ